MEPADLSKVTERIATALGSNDLHTRRHIGKLVLLLGDKRVDELRIEAHQFVMLRQELSDTEAAPLTLRDTFFALAVQHLNPTQRLIVFGPLGWQGAEVELPAIAPTLPAPHAPRPSARPLAWIERREAIAAASGACGTVQSTLVTLTGIPDKIITVNETIIMLITDTRVPRLPPGLPALPPTPTQYVVYLAARRWRRVAPQLNDAAHTLLITGWSVYDPTVRRIAIFAQRVTARQMRS